MAMLFHLALTNRMKKLNASCLFSSRSLIFSGELHFGEKCLVPALVK